MTKSAAELTVPEVKSASALQQPLSADWFSEVKELRQKAEEYRYVNVIYRFSSISRSARAIVKFQKLRSFSEIAQNILIVHHIDRRG